MRSNVGIPRGPPAVKCCWDDCSILLCCLNSLSVHRWALMEVDVGHYSPLCLSIIHVSVSISSSICLHVSLRWDITRVMHNECVGVFIAWIKPKGKKWTLTFPSQPVLGSFTQSMKTGNYRPGLAQQRPNLQLLQVPQTLFEYGLYHRCHHE